MFRFNSRGSKLGSFVASEENNPTCFFGIAFEHQFSFATTAYDYGAGRSKELSPGKWRHYNPSMRGSKGLYGFPRIKVSSEYLFQTHSHWEAILSRGKATVTELEGPFTQPGKFLVMSSNHNHTSIFSRVPGE